MPIVPAFTTSQIIGQPSVIVFTDVSTGSDVNIVERHIYIRLDDGMYLTVAGKFVDPAFTIWPLATNPFNLDILSKDTAANITVIWSDSAGFLLVNSTTILLINSTDKLSI